MQNSSDEHRSGKSFVFRLSYISNWRVFNWHAIIDCRHFKSANVLLKKTTPQQTFASDRTFNETEVKAGYSIYTWFCIFLSWASLELWRWSFLLTISLQLWSGIILTKLKKCKLLGNLIRLDIKVYIILLSFLFKVNFSVIIAL